MFKILALKRESEVFAMTVVIKYQDSVQTSDTTITTAFSSSSTGNPSNYPDYLMLAARHAAVSLFGDKKHWSPALCMANFYIQAGYNNGNQFQRLELTCPYELNPEPLASVQMLRYQIYYLPQFIAPDGKHGFYETLELYYAPMRRHNTATPVYNARYVPVHRWRDEITHASPAPTEES
jgi:hypothetical protein